MKMCMWFRRQYRFVYTYTYICVCIYLLALSVGVVTDGDELARNNSTVLLLQELWKELTLKLPNLDSQKSTPRTLATVNSTECHLRLLAYEYALHLQPQRAPLLGVFDSLKLTKDCGLSRPALQPKLDTSTEKEGFRFKDSDTFVFVDYVNGDDDNGAGTRSSPKKTIKAALGLLRLSLTGSVDMYDCKIILRKGIHYISEPIEIRPKDSGLTIMNYPGEDVWISGGVVLNDLNWDPYSHGHVKYLYTETKTNIWVANIKHIIERHHIDFDFEALHTIIPHKRLIRARFPNSADPEDRSTVRTVKGLKWLPPDEVLPRTDIDIVVNYSNKSDSLLWQYNIYANSRCSTAGSVSCPCGAWEDNTENGTTISSSYWCNKNIAGGWAEEDQGNGYYNGPVLPEGLSYNTSENSLLSRAKFWKNATGATVVGWRAQGWFVNMFKVAHHDKEQGILSWPRWSGGWQGGRGWQTNKTNGEISPTPPFYIEGVLEELDMENEWFYDPSSYRLYIYYPSVNANPRPFANYSQSTKEMRRMRVLRSHLSKPRESEELVVPKLTELFRIVGGKRFSNSSTASHKWVHNITIQGIGLRDTRPVFLAKKWGVPSGGDWALSRTAAVFIEGSVNINIRNCNFRRLNGNGILLSGYNRFATIEGNEFSFIGDTAIATWGYTDENSGINGAQPRFTTIRSNYAHDVGIYQLQSAMYFQAKSCLNNVYKNIFFDGPRSGINFNDGFGGGTNVSQNLLFNLCKQSGDHGNINSWDRQIFTTDINPSSPFTPLYNNIFKNFILATHGASQGVDNDDGSSYYNISSNVMFGEGLKQDYGGHDSIYRNNLNIVHKYDGQNCINTWPFVPGHGHFFGDNRCIVNYETTEYGKIAGCDPSNLDNEKYQQLLKRNRYYTPSGIAKLRCGSKLLDLEYIQNHSFTKKMEENSTVDKIPSNSRIIEWARKVLEFDYYLIEGIFQNTNTNQN